MARTPWIARPPTTLAGACDEYQPAFRTAPAGQPRTALVMDHLSGRDTPRDTSVAEHERTARYPQPRRLGGGASTPAAPQLHAPVQLAATGYFVTDPAGADARSRLHRTVADDWHAALTPRATHLAGTGRGRGTPAGRPVDCTPATCHRAGMSVPHPHPPASPPDALPTVPHGPPVTLGHAEEHARPYSSYPSGEQHRDRL